MKRSNVMKKTDFFLRKLENATRVQTMSESRIITG